MHVCSTRCYLFTTFRVEAVEPRETLAPPPANGELKEVIVERMISAGYVLGGSILDRAKEVRNIAARQIQIETFDSCFVQYDLRMMTPNTSNDVRPICCSSPCTVI